ncbi:MAG: hypothetical protein JWR32_4995 [Mycobacterium sp.]|nr:hypothetical protein [Mycobacterium sp.]
MPKGGKAVELHPWRPAALIAGLLAAVLLVIVGCTSVTGGTAKVDAKDAPAYRTSASISVSESAATSSERESKRQQSMTTQAVHHSCDSLASSSVDAITAVNAYVGAFNNGGSGAASSKEGPAIDSLNHSADLVSGSLTPDLSPQLHDALSGWVDAARAVAGAISSHASPDDFNSAVGRLNDAKTKALNLCDAAY